MKTTPDNEILATLITSARKGKVVLPQFQRNFVWSRDDITALLVSILQGHFIGSFLLLDIHYDEVPFAMRPLQGVDLNQGQLHPDKMVLDGQQRMTSLHYAFAAPEIALRWTKHPYRFFLDLKKVTQGDLENAVSSERTVDCKAMLDQRRQFETLVLPFTEVEHWDAWLNQYEQWLVQKDKDAYFQQYFPVDKPAWNTVIGRIRAFLVPTITIPKIQPGDPEALAEVCAIFEKINSTGVKLSVYDLLTARLYKDGIDIHGLWEEAVDEHHLLDDYSEGMPDEFGVYTLRTIALMRGMDVKNRSLINMAPADFAKDWRTAAAYMEKALERMTTVDQDGFGAFERKWMPYITMVSPLAAMLATIDNQKLEHQAYKLMRRWYWSAIFRERYAASVESNVYRDYQDFLKAVKDPTYEPDALRDGRTNILENQAYSLQNVSRLNSVYRGVICLIALNHARDFSADDSIQFHTLEDHHIFPVAYLKEQRGADGKPLSNDQINCVLNRTLISDQTNRKISEMKPSQYVVKLIPAEPGPAILVSHFVTGEALAAMQADDFGAFQVAREQALIKAIVKKVGG